MTLLEFSQILLNFLLSFAIILFCGIFIVLGVAITRFINVVKKTLDELKRESGEIYSKINNFFENIAKLSFISNWFKFKKKSNNKK